MIVVDDHSSDRTAAVAAEAGASVIQAGPLPPGWSGKLWAISEGLETRGSLAPDYLLFTDADIVHAPDNIAELVARAEAGQLDLVSLMVKLRCRSFAETLLIPAFVFFFFMLYPPAWVARRDRRTAAAAGGCILIRPSALDRIGGIASHSQRNHRRLRTGPRRQTHRRRHLARGHATTPQHSRLQHFRRNPRHDLAHRLRPACVTPLCCCSEPFSGWLSSISPRLCCSSPEIRLRLFFGLAAWILMTHRLLTRVALLRPIRRVGAAAAAGRVILHVGHPRFRAFLLDRTRRHLEGSSTGCQDNQEPRHHRPQSRNRIALPSHLLVRRSNQAQVRGARSHQRVLGLFEKAPGRMRSDARPRLPLSHQGQLPAHLRARPHRAWFIPMASGITPRRPKCWSASSKNI